jgi:hypothetical protein
MSRFNGFGLRFAMGAVMASSLVGGTLALSTGTASAAPSERHLDCRCYVALPFHRVDTTYVFLDKLLDDGGRGKVGSMSLGGGRPAEENRSFDLINGSIPFLGHEGDPN